MLKKHAVVAIFRTHEAATAAVRELQHLGFDMTKLSIVGRGYQTEDHVIGFFNTDERVKVWSKRGAFLGGLTGLLLGSGILIVPGIGPLVLLGPVVSWFVNAATGAAVASGLSALGAALYSHGIPEDSVLRYERAIKAEKYLLILEGGVSEIEEAKGLLETSAELAEMHRLSLTRADVD